MNEKRKPLIIILILALVMIIPAIVVSVVNSSGNSKQYSVDKAQTSQNTEITDKEILFLGSSFTNGYKSDGESFVDYLQKVNGVYPLKLSENKSKMIGDKKDCYIPRLKELSKEHRPHFFMCELSPYDAMGKMKMGELADNYRIDSFDTTTLIGTLEYIVCYAQETWRCPVIFYTCPNVEDEDYEDMIKALEQVCDKWNLKMLDLYNDDDFKTLDDKEMKLYFDEPFCPTKAGYKELITPKFEDFIIEFMS